MSLLMSSISLNILNALVKSPASLLVSKIKAIYQYNYRPV